MYQSYFEYNEDVEGEYMPDFQKLKEDLKTIDEVDEATNTLIKSLFDTIVKQGEKDFDKDELEIIFNKIKIQYENQEQADKTKLNFGLICYFLGNKEKKLKQDKTKLNLGLIYYILGNKEKAISKLKQSNHIEAKWILANLMITKKKDAINSLQTGAKLGCRKCQIELSRHYIKEKAFKKAKDILVSLCLNFEGVSQKIKMKTFGNLAKIYFFQEEFQKCLEIIDKIPKDYYCEVDAVEHVFSLMMCNKFVEAKQILNDICLSNDDIIKIIDLVYKKELNKNKKIKDIVTVLEKFFIIKDENSFENNVLEKIYLLFVDFGSIKPFENLAHIYWNKKDYEKSFKMFKKSFISGQIESAFDIGEFYYRGYYVENNIYIALFYFTQYFDKFSNKNKIKALHFISDMDINPPYKISKAWKKKYYNFLSQQSERNNVEEIANLINLRLAHYLYLGIGTQKDFDGALSILHKLCQKGYQPAKILLKSFYTNYKLHYYTFNIRI